MVGSGIIKQDEFKGLWARCDEEAMADLFFTEMLDKIAGVPICDDGEKCTIISKLECKQGEYKVSRLRNPSSRGRIQQGVAKLEGLEPYLNDGMDSLITLGKTASTFCIFTAIASIPLASIVLKKILADLWGGQVARHGQDLVMVQEGQMVPARPSGRPRQSPARRRRARGG